MRLLVEQEQEPVPVPVPVQEQEQEQELLLVEEVFVRFLGRIHGGISHISITKHKTTVK